MLMGCMSPAHPEHEFDGKIMNKRVSEMRKYDKTTHNQNFSDLAWINGALKEGEWGKFLVDGMNLGDLKDALALNYGLAADIVVGL